MKSIYRFLTILSVLILVGVLLGACGGAATPAPAQEKPAAEAPATAAPATQAPAAAKPATEEAMATEEAKATEEAAAPAATEEAAAAGGEEVALRWRTRPDTQAEIDVYQAVSDAIDKELPNVKLTYEPGGSETSSYQDVLKTEIAAGTAPDVFWIPGTDVAEFATRGLIMDLREMAAGTEGYSDDLFYPGPMFHLTFNPESGKSGETLWGLPRDVSTFALYLNMDLINEAGAPDPRELAKAGKWNWDSFVEVAQKVRELGTDIYGYGANAWWGPYGTWLKRSRRRFLQQGSGGLRVEHAGVVEGVRV